MPPLLHRQVHRTVTRRIVTVAAVDIAVLTVQGTYPNPALHPVIVTHGWPNAEGATDTFSRMRDAQLNALLASGYTCQLVFTGSCWATNTISPASAGAGGLAAIDAGVAASAAMGLDTSQIYLYGTSHGGGVALRWAWENPDLVAAAYLYAPFVDFAATYDTAMADTLGIRTSMQAVTGTANRTAMLAAAAPFDPVRNIASLAYVGERIAVLGLSADEVIPYASLDAFGGAIGATVTTSPGSHFFVSTSNWDELDVPRWFKSNPGAP